MKIKIFLSMFALSLGMIACSDRVEGEMTTSNHQEKNAPSLNKIDKGSISFTFRLGRVSRDCGGFGVCELSAVGVTIVQGPVHITVSHNLDPDAPDFSLNGAYKLNSAEELDAAGELNGDGDTTFYIDQDFYSSDEDGDKYLFHKGAYKFDPSIGEFGGYPIDVTQL